MKIFLHLILLALLASLLPFSSASAAEQPNIVLMMVDDLGWNHISAGKMTMETHKEIYQTPNLEKLARGGLSFTHAYAQPNCAPTRAAMLTGEYPARVHNDVYVVGSLNRYGKRRSEVKFVKRRPPGSKQEAKFTGPPQSHDVSPEAITIAEALQKNGYATAHIGKFHVGGNRGSKTSPESAGFDINIGGGSAGSHRACFASKKGDQWEFKNTALGDLDRFAEPYTAAYLKEKNFPESLVGTPKHICDAMGDAMEETIQKLNAKKKPFYLQFYTFAVHGPVGARPDLKKQLGNYPGFIAGVDSNVGRLLAALEDPNGDGDKGDSIAKNTVVFFTSDNGGTHADNQPLRGWKGMLTEGGVRVPLIAYWPGTIPADTATSYPVHAVDYYPTCLALAGNKWTPPKAEHPLDGSSFAKVLRDPSAKSTRGTIFYLFPGYLDIRAEPTVVAIDEINGKKYKLYYFYETDSWELYSLSDDIGEEKDILKQSPEIAATLSKKINAWLLQKDSTWQPKYPLKKGTEKSAGPPPVL